MDLEEYSLINDHSQLIHKTKGDFEREQIERETLIKILKHFDNPDKFLQKLQKKYNKKHRAQYNLTKWVDLPVMSINPLGKVAPLEQEVIFRHIQPKLHEHLDKIFGYGFSTRICYSKSPYSQIYTLYLFWNPQIGLPCKKYYI